MKFIVTFKSPDALDTSLEDYPELDAEKAKEFAEKWIEYGEYIDTGTIIAEKNRAKMNRLNDAQRNALLTRGMQLIYGGSTTTKAPVAERTGRVLARKRGDGREAPLRLDIYKISVRLVIVKPLSFKHKAAIRKYLKSVRDAVVAADFDAGYLIKDLGFVKRQCDPICSSDYYFVSKKLGVVLKFSYLSSRRLPSPYCIPTIYAINPHYVPDPDVDLRAMKVGKYAVFQPLVDTSQQMRAYSQLRDLNVEKHVIDFADRNCGHYGDRPVVIDW